MPDRSLLEDYRETLDALHKARAPRLDALRAATRAALDDVAGLTRREATAARKAVRALRAALANDARFLLDDAEFLAFRKSLGLRRARGEGDASPSLTRLREGDLRVAFEGYRRRIETEYNDEEHFLVRRVTTRITVGARSREVDVDVAERFVANVRFVRARLSVGEIPYQLDDLVAAALDASSTVDAPIGREARRTLVDALRDEVGALLLFALPLLRPAPLKAKLPWP